MRSHLWLIAGLLLSSSWAFALTAEEHCGDDLRCYYSAEELEEAFGGQVSDFEFQTMGAFDLYAEEDGGFSDAAEDLFQRAGRTENAPIWGSFIRNLKACAPGCVPANYSTYGKRRQASCHNSGRAVDVGAIVCKGVTHTALRGGKFKDMVECMSGKMIVLYRNGKHRTLGHNDHAHFSNGCTLPNGRKYH